MEVFRVKEFFTGGPPLLPSLFLKGTCHPEEEKAELARV